MNYKLFFLLTFLLPAYTLCAQENLYELVRTETCTCLTKIYRQKGISQSDLNECLRASLINNTKALNSEVKKKFADSASYEKGYIYGQELGRRLDTALIYSCDDYFKGLDSLRFTFINRYNKDSVLQLYSKLNNSAMIRDETYYLEKARLGFILGHYEACLLDLSDPSISQENKNSLLIIKGLALDRIGKYGQAAEVFYTLETLSNNATYLVHAAIENRKAAKTK